MNKNKEKATRKSKKAIKMLLLDVFFVLFGILGVTSGTIAWFTTQSSFQTETGTFGIAAMGGLSYDLYYLDSFNVDEQEKDGNWNSSISAFSGYEVDYSSANFLLVNDDADPNPTDIDQLWPAHKLTFAILIEGTDFDSLTIETWTEKLVDDDIPMSVIPAVGEGDDTYMRISLAWAIDIFGKAYTLTKTTGLGNEANDIARAYAIYKNVAIDSDYDSLPSADKPTKAPDAFDYAPNVEIDGTTSGDELTVTPVDAVVADSDNIVAIQDGGVNDRTIIFFTIEFSNNSGTFYSESGSEFIIDPEDENDEGHNEFYYNLDTTGNSNCYEKLRFKHLGLKLE